MNYQTPKAIMEHLKAGKEFVAEVKANPKSFIKKIEQSQPGVKIILHFNNDNDYYFIIPSGINDNLHDGVFQSVVGGGIHILGTAGTFGTVSTIASEALSCFSSVICVSTAGTLGSREV